MSTLPIPNIQPYQEEETEEEKYDKLETEFKSITEIQLKKFVKYLYEEGKDIVDIFKSSIGTKIHIQKIKCLFKIIRKNSIEEKDMECLKFITDLSNHPFFNDEEKAILNELKHMIKNLNGDSNYKSNICLNLSLLNTLISYISKKVFS